jgi:hypothetical protein
VLFTDLAPHDPFGEAHDRHIGNRNGFRWIVESNRCCVRLLFLASALTFTLVAAFLLREFFLTPQRPRF